MNINNYSKFKNEIEKTPENFYIIHYSCEGLNDRNKELSPRITSIAIMHYQTGQTTSFSTHMEAEILCIPRDKVSDQFDDVEKAILKKFYRFIQDLQGKYWIHWNMKNATYGFQHIEHRYSVLFQQEIPSKIDIENRINIHDLLTEKYGGDYANEPYMVNLMDINNGKRRDFLTGKEEVEAFQKKDFLAMHNSTLCKVKFFQYVIKQMLANKLIVTSKLWSIWLDKLFESRCNKLIALISGFLAIFGFSCTIITYLITIT